MVTANPEQFENHAGHHAPAGNRNVLLGALLAAGVALIAVVVWSFSSDSASTDTTLVFYTVKRSDLPIQVTENGNLQSQTTTAVRCQVENFGRDRSGTQILSIVENGSDVKEGDLLVELDSALITERLDEQELQTERSRNEQIQATVTFENQKTQNETLLAEAKLQLALDELGLQQYEDEEGGTFQLDLQLLDLNIQTAEANRLIRQTDLKGTEQLAKLGYRSKGDLEQARLAALSADTEVARQVSTRKEMVDYTYRKTKMELEGKVATAKRSMLQVERNNEASLLQAEAAKIAADRAFTKETEKLEKYKKQLEKCKIFAPHGGMATYATDRDGKTRMAEGRTVYERQRIITLPDLSAMEVKTGVHESVLDSIQAGLPATITVDAFPNHKFKGRIKSVAVLADRGEWHSTDVKVYTTIVTINEGELIEGIRPGMSAVVDIHVERVEDVLTVPVTAVAQIGEENWIYVESAGGVDKVRVTLGKTNEKFIEITEGLAEGQRVVINPMALLQAEENTGNKIDPEDDLNDTIEYGLQESDKTAPDGTKSKDAKASKASSKQSAKKSVDKAKAKSGGK
jgi:RND family efflux transporter MFP subunit